MSAIFLPLPFRFIIKMTLKVKFYFIIVEILKKFFNLFLLLKIEVKINLIYNLKE